jgi:phage FluMu protein Com
MLNIRCAFCQTPYTLSRITMIDALQEVDSQKLSHYDAQCPRCRRVTQIPRQRLEMAMPNWRNELKEFEAEMKEHPQQEAPLPTPEAASTAAAEPKPEPKTAKEKPAAKAKTASKASSSKEKAPAKKPATTSQGKSTTKKSR